MNKSPGIFGRTRSAIGYVLKTDFCPSFNPYVYWLKQPIGWVVCAMLSSLMIGLFIGPQGFVLMWSFLALLVVGVAWPWISIKAISCELCFEDEKAFEGVETVAILKIKNSWPIPAYGLAVEGSFLQEIIDEDDLVAVGLEKVAGWSVSTFKWKLTPKRRGQLPANPPTLTTGFPFGIYKCSKELKVKEGIIVWPNSKSLDGKPKTYTAQLRHDDMPDDKSGTTGETIGVRDFRQGDSFRHVHWAKTAQNNRLVVREFQSYCSEEAHLIVDLSPSSHSGAGIQSSFEWAIRAAAAVCRQLDRHQFTIKLDCVGLPTNFASSASNQNGLSSLMDYLALLPDLEGLDAAGCAPFGQESFQFNPRVKLKYLICTDRLTLGQPLPRGVKKIQLASEHYEEDRMPAELNIESEPNCEQGTLVLSSPSSAASDLAAGWKSSYSYGI